MRRGATTLAALTMALTACGTDDGAGSDDDGATFEYSSDRVAPPLGENENGSDTSPSEFTDELELESGATLALWIDPQDIRRIFVQHSDPDDPARWTEPELLFTAGDGCLTIDADTDGGTVAATFGCYETDAFGQQAPDQGQAVVTTDLREWEVEDMGEFYGAPEVSADGSEVSWPEDDVTWSKDEGF